MMLSFLLTCLLVLPAAEKDTVLVPSVVSASKLDPSVEKSASPVTTVHLQEMQAFNLRRPLSLGALVPGLHIPDYGASLTSTIYMRGFGSRMENPVTALYLDDIPIIDKNAYDFEWEGIRSASFLRGPQGTIFGRNSMCGVLSLRTVPASHTSHLAYLEAGTAASFRAGTSFSLDRNRVTIGFKHTDGYFTNEYTGKECDPYTGGNLLWTWGKRANERLTISNLFLLTASSEGGFAYGRFLEGKLQPVSFNDPNGYRRLSAIEGFKARYKTETVNLDFISSLQLLSDKMDMDQDFTPESVFTLMQRQGSGAATIEIIVRPVKKDSNWHPQTGFFCFAKYNDMSAPVNFKSDGIRSLILDNANRNIPEDIGRLTILDEEFPITSDFDILTWNAALYHESVLETGSWRITGGFRFDYEGGWMGYDSEGNMNYRFIPFMASPKPFQTIYKGSVARSSLEFLPKFSVMYFLSPETTAHASVSKGFRAGGFNTQIFSDILQGKMMTGLMDDLGVHLDGMTPSVDARNTRYDPEKAWCFEIGLKTNSWHGLDAGICIYDMEAVGQQLTVFPPGKTTGRMMTNAGRSRSFGAETEVDYRKGRFHSRISHSWNRSRFIHYDDGNTDYSGNIVPYTPEHTLYIGADYRIPAGAEEITLSASLKGNGPVWWNENNELKEPFRLCPGGRVSFSLKKATFYIYGENLSGKQYRTFYFKSVGNEFFALTKPRRVLAGLIFNY